MAYAPHNRVKPERLASAAAEVLEQSLSLPAVFRREGFDAYQGVKGDAVTIRVEGILPFHRYTFRNDRSTPITTDTYDERSITITLADHFYSAVQLTDEQREWDLLDFSFLLGKQARAVARGLQRAAQDKIENAPYQVTIGGAEVDVLASITEARRVLNRFQVPAGTRTLVVGSDFEQALQTEDRIQLASNSGDGNANSALRDATVGRIKGFNVVLDNTIDPVAAYAIVDNGFVWANAAPMVPRSVAYGATSSFEGVALRLMQDYVHDYMYDRQVTDTWSGMRYVEDVLVGWDPAGSGGLGAEVVSTNEYFVRGVKLTLDGTSTYPAAASELDTITGINATEGFENGVRDDLTV